MARSRLATAAASAVDRAVSRADDPSCTCCCAVASASSADRRRRPCALHLASSCSALPKGEECESEEAQTPWCLRQRKVLKGMRATLGERQLLCCLAYVAQYKIPPVQYSAIVCRAPIVRAAPYGLAPSSLAHKWVMGASSRESIVRLTGTTGCGNVCLLSMMPRLWRSAASSAVTSTARWLAAPCSAACINLLTASHPNAPSLAIFHNAMMTMRCRQMRCLELADHTSTIEGSPPARQ